MKDRVVASRYARAFYQAAAAAKAGDKARQDLRKFAQLLRTDERLKRTLEHPLVPMAEKTRAALASLGKAQSPVFEKFLVTVLRKKRLSLVSHMAALFDELVDEAAGVQKVHVKSAAALSAEQVQELEKRLGKSWDKKVVADVSVDESLIGGLVLRVGDKVWDRSLRGQLKNLKSKLLEATTI